MYNLSPADLPKKEIVPIGNHMIKRRALTPAEAVAQASVPESVSQGL